MEERPLGYAPNYCVLHARTLVERIDFARLGLQTTPNGRLGQLTHFRIWRRERRTEDTRAPTDRHGIFGAFR
jgi:hypothetical protein